MDGLDQLVDAEPGNQLQCLIVRAQPQAVLDGFVYLRFRIRTLRELLAQELSHQRVEFQCVFARCEAEIACGFDHLVGQDAKKVFNRPRAERGKERQAEKVLS